MKPGYAAMVALGLQGWTDLPYCHCYTFTFQNGSVQRYTDYDVPVWSGGNYFAANAVRINGLKMKQTTGVDIDEQNVDLIYGPNDSIFGVAWGAAIRDHVLDGCYVQRDRAFFVPGTSYVDPIHGATAAGFVTMNRMRVAAVTGYGRTMAQINLKSDLVLLDIDFPRNLWQASCLHTLYDSGCTLSKGAYQSFGVTGAGATNTVITFVNGGSGAVIGVSMSGAAGAPISRLVLTSQASINNYYLGPPSVTITDPTGSGAVFKPVMSKLLGNGYYQLAGFIKISGGTAYTNPTVAIGAGTAGTATAEAVLGAGSQSGYGLSVSSGGSAYSQAAQLVFTGGGGTGMAGKLTISAAGVITGAQLTEYGTGYYTAPTASVVDTPFVNFAQGSLMFQGGENAGALVQIKSASSTALTLANPLLYVPNAGDVFSVWPGCDHTLGAGGCAKFNNQANFRGFPYVPAPEYAY